MKIILEKSLLFICVLFLAIISTSHTQAYEKPILLIGASYADSRAPYNQGFISPIPGGMPNFGSYDDLEDTFIRMGYRVVQTAQGGATTLSRFSCAPSLTCGPGFWDGYDIQLERAISYVRDSSNPQKPILNADYVYISGTNDCFHPNAFGVPWDVAKPCTAVDFNQIADRLIAVGKTALKNGLTPIYGRYPRYSVLDLELFRQLVGFPWVIDEANHSEFIGLLEKRITSELPEAIYVKTVWDKFKHIGDGIHPDSASVKFAVKEILSAIKVHSGKNY